MKVFVTGGSGFVGSNVIDVLIDHGHEVSALSRSESSTKKLKSKGISQIIQGDLENYEILSKAAQLVDAIIHCGFIHDFTQFDRSCEVEKNVLKTFAESLEQQAVKDGKKKKLIYCDGLLRVSIDGSFMDENTPLDTAFPRFKGSKEIKDNHLNKNIDFYLIRLPPCVHGKTDSGFVNFLGSIAQQNQFVFYVGEGKNSWCGVHVLDVAQLFVKVLESHADNDSKGEFFVVNANQETAIPTKDIAEAIGKKLGLPTKSVDPQEAVKFGFIGVAFGNMGFPVKNEITRKKYHWEPKNLGLLEDIQENYFNN